jgi:hypothetical protein
MKESANTVRYQGTIVGSASRLLIGIWGLDVIRELARTLEHVALIIGAIHVTATEDKERGVGGGRKYNTHVSSAASALASSSVCDTPMRLR